jgi:hypothetical protein
MTDSQAERSIGEKASTLYNRSILKTNRCRERVACTCHTSDVCVYSGLREDDTGKNVRFFDEFKDPKLDRDS